MTLLLFQQKVQKLALSLLCENVTIPANSMKIIRTGISFKIPRGYFGKIYARSSLAVRCTEVGGGVIDADYRGFVAVFF